MKKKWVSYVLLIISIFFISCVSDNFCIEGADKIITKEINLETIIGVDLQISNNVTIKQGTVQKVIITGNENIIALIKTEIHSGIWDIALLDACYTNYSLQIEITVPNIDTINISGSGNINVKDFDNQNDMVLKVSGSGDIDLNKVSGAENLNVKISGSGNINLLDDFSLLERIDVSMSGSGSFYGFNAQTKVCDVSNSGSGSNEVSVTEKLNVSISGSGNTYYKGNPEVIKSISGSGNIINVN